MKKIISSVLLMFLFSLVLLLTSCELPSFGDEDDDEEDEKSTIKGTFSYDSEMLSEHKDDLSYGYNNNLFYVNNLEFQVADPSVIFVTEGEEKGWFYCYGTSDEIGGHGFQSWRSKDLSHWEAMGVALEPFTWAINCYWAPEVIYDNGLYYMFFGAYNLLENNRLCISVAVSENPYGPFVQPSGIRDANGDFISADKPVFDFGPNNKVLQQVEADYKLAHPTYTENFVKTNYLDVSPFIDPKTNDKYLLFSCYDSYGGEGSSIYGVKMKNWYTPDYATLTRLTYPGYNTVENGINFAFGDGIRLSEGNVNEGPFMIYHEGKYYLTLSIFGYTDPSYQVIQAVADSPLGDFRKIPADDGGKVISTDVSNWSHITSAGHHSFVDVYGELFIAYHTFKNRTDISNGRALAVDPVKWIKNDKGEDIMFTNGPTWSVQPLPEGISGYKNIAPEAKITVKNAYPDSDEALLTDGLIKYQEFDLAEEFELEEGDSEITLSFDKYKMISSIMVYNSYDYDQTFVNIKSVEMQVMTADGGSEIVTVKNVPFDWNWHFEADYQFIRPGGAAILEFKEMPIKKITIKISSPEGAEGVSLNEIVVLGSKNKIKGVSKFEKYTYEVTKYGSSHIKKDSLNFGDVAGTGLQTEYGYDLSHDDGTENAYVEQRGPADQSCYFKGIYDTEFYVEAEFTVTADGAFAYNNDLHDPYPKFGLQLSCDDDAKNTIFYYVDAVGYTNKAVGVAQRMMDNTNWDWQATEQVVQVSNMSYTKGNYVKLAILRLGGDFYFLCNDQITIHYSTFNIFNDLQNAAPGFRCFSTAMKIKNYIATTDKEVINQKKEQYVSKINGLNLGDFGGFKMTPGWDLQNDNGVNPVARQTLGGDQYAYFKNVEGNKYYVEINIKVIEDLGDAWPKFGLALRSNDNTLFFYVDGSAGYTSQKVGYVWRNEANDNWVWGESQEFEAGVEYTGEKYAKLGILRDGATIKLYANGNLIATLENVRSFDVDTRLALGVLSFTTGIEIKDYFVTTDTTRFPL